MKIVSLNRNLSPEEWQKILDSCRYYSEQEIFVTCFYSEKQVVAYAQEGRVHVGIEKMLIVEIGSRSDLDIQVLKDLANVIGEATKQIINFSGGSYSTLRDDEWVMGVF